MGTYYSARACESELLVREEDLEAIDTYVRGVGLAGEKDRIDLGALAAPRAGVVTIDPTFDGGESLFLGDVPYSMDERIAEFLSAWCLPGSRFEWLDEDEMVFGRLLVEEEGKVREELRAVENPFDRAAFSVPTDLVVESVDWEAICGVLEIDLESVAGDLADEIVQLAVKRYRQAIDECIGDTRYDIFRDACKKVAEEYGVDIPIGDS